MSKLRKMLTIIALGISGGSIFVLPYIKYSFYDQLIEVMGISNQQLGFLLTMYAIGCIALYIPGGILADKFSPKKVVIISLLGTSLLSVIFAFTFEYSVAVVVWLLLAFSSGFVFWSSIMKAIRMIGEEQEQAKVYGFYYAANGSAAAVISAIAIWSVSWFDSTEAGLRAAILVMAAGTTIAAILVAILLDEKKQSSNSNIQDTPDEEKFKFKDVTTLMKNPLLWVISLTIFCTYGLYTSGSYFIPYLTEVTGISSESSGLIGIIRTYIFMLVCAPLGGFIADKLKSTAKWFMISFAVLVALFIGVLLIDSGYPAWLIIFISLLPGAFSLMMYGIMFSIISECKIPRSLTGTAIGIASIIGYMPDFFFNTLFGNWLDNYGNTGYTYIFIFLGSLGILGFILSYIIRKSTLKLKKA